MDGARTPKAGEWFTNPDHATTLKPQDTVDELFSMGHAPQNPIMATAQSVFLGNSRGLIFGGGQAVMKLDKGYVAGSDSRRDGVAATH
ncbi:MAG: hypothetical protein KKF22_09285 [Gammaproteobacteria bacterium]|nr:hypothetical protein [Gammaproteobacteria bacterium]